MGKRVVLEKFLEKEEENRVELEKFLEKEEEKLSVRLAKERRTF